MKPMIEAAGVQAWYGTSHVLRGVDFRVDAGETVGLLGRNGMGKSTLLRTLLGHVTQRAGTAWLCLLLALGLLTSACGKYDRPRRVVRPPPAETVETLESEIADEEADAFDPDGPGGEPPGSAVEEEDLEP